MLGVRPPRGQAFRTDDPHAADLARVVAAIVDEATSGGLFQTVSEPARRPKPVTTAPNSPMTSTYTFIADRPVRSLKAKVRALTNMRSQQNPGAVLIRLNQITRGCANYFSTPPANARSVACPTSCTRRVIRWLRALRRWTWKRALPESPERPCFRLAVSASPLHTDCLWALPVGMPIRPAVPPPHCRFSDILDVVLCHPRDDLFFEQPAAALRALHAELPAVAEHKAKP
jgi:hypothetical protein